MRESKCNGKVIIFHNVLKENISDGGYLDLILRGFKCLLSGPIIGFLLDIT